MGSKISFIYHPKYDIPLPISHRFTSSKFSDLFQELKITGLIGNSVLLTPTSATLADLSITHNPDYIAKFESGNLSSDELRRLGLPWTKELVERSFLAVNGTYLTAIEALRNGVACHLAGGTHHSHYDFGSGFCVFNDMAFAAVQLLNQRIIKRILIFDCDVHQGDGTAAILENNSKVFTCSIHCRKNFPARKMKSDLDIELDDNLGNKDYLQILRNTLKNCTSRFFPDLVIYDAGVDVSQTDRLGRLKLDIDGIYERDFCVLEYFKSLSIPVATVIGGGYSSDPKELARRHSQVFHAAQNLHGFIK